jgi:hypothetical protein
MTRIFLGLCGLLGVAVAGCDEADKIFDCQSVCSRYQSCFDKSYDVGSCRNRCKDKADADKDFEQKADSCEKCIDDKSCAAATFSCVPECSSIVP